MMHTLLLNCKDPDRRRYVGAKLGGKLIGVMLVMAAIYGFTWYFSTHAGASMPGQAAVKATEVVNGLNTAWVLVTAFLVFFMQAGFMMLEGGFARTREVSNIMIECIADTASVRHALLGVRLRVHVRVRQRLDRAPLLLPQDIPHAYTYGGPSTPASRSWRSSSSSSRSPTPAARSRRARWSGVPRSAVTCSTASR